MLISLTIHHIAVIRNVQIEFGNGLNVLTGETGAGKSIIIDALNMVLGNRTTKSLIRTGEEKASVSAIFQIHPNLQGYLGENGFPCEDGELLLYREIHNSGKSIVRINGRPATATVLRDLSEHLINIHGQHDNQSLMNPEKHLHILDDFCGNHQELENYREIYHRYREIEQELRQLQMDEEEKARRQRMLEFEVQEIEAASLQEDEEEELLAKKHLLSNAQTILQSVTCAYDLLYGSSNAYEKMGDAVKCLEQAAEYDGTLNTSKDMAYDVYYNIESVAEMLRQYQDRFEYDEAEAEQIETRLGVIRDLKRRYGGNFSKIHSYYLQAKAELSTILHLDERLTELKELYEQVARELEAAASVLTETRQKGAEKLSQQIMHELADLNMPNTVFQVSFSSVEDVTQFHEFGKEKAEFLMSANLGQEVDRLSKIASGGELSRIMLAIKSAVFEKEGAETLIFDEIDAGVSGRAAQKIAEKLYRVSDNHQVLCVTHLPQIAAMADHHYLIEKNVTQEETLTTVCCLEDEKKAEEIARIIGGVKITDAAIHHAKEMLALSETLKKG